MECRYKVLLVDSSKSFREMFSIVLSSANMDSRKFDARSVSSAGEALTILGAEQFDMVCSALYLPDMGGIELCHAMRSGTGHKTTPFILFTSEMRSDLMAEVLPEGVTDVFQKEEFSALLNFIRRYPFGRTEIHGHLLYVEDERSVRQFMVEMFKRHGLTVDAFENADMAWEHFLKNDYDLVVTDVVLTGRMSGLVFANRIRRLSGNKGDVPILAITAFDDASRRVELYSMGVDDYVTKPALEQEIISRIENLISRRRGFLETQRLQQVAEQALAAKNDFLSAMTHELRTPLNAILGFAQLLESDAVAPLNQDQTESVDAIIGAGNHLLELINDMLDLSKIVAGKMEMFPEPLDVSEVLASLLGMIRNQVEQRGLTVECREPTEAYFISADPLRYRQVLLNLLSNAVKYNCQGGKIVVESQCNGQGRLRVSVTDTGNGIPADKLADIFEPFTRLQEHRYIVGTGIGLSVAKKLTEMMGGTLSVTSEVGVGSTFSLEMPIVERGQPSQEAPVKEEIVLAPQGERLRVLVVDDNPVNRKLLTAVIRKHLADAIVDNAESGEQSLLLARENRPDIVFLDISMPGMDGFATLKAMRAMTGMAQQPIVAVTANAMEVDRTRGMAAGFDAYITKPVKFDEIKKMLRLAQRG